MANMRWYVAATAAHKESLAALNLSRQGFKFFLPRRKTTIKHGRKMTTKDTPYFPGYIFTSFDVERDRWQPVNGTLGVKSLLMNGERPIPTPVGFVEALMRATDSSGLVDLSGSLVCGAKVRFAAGPFADQLGILDRIDSQGRVRVLFQIMHRETAVSMHGADLLEIV
jgi:transcription antitermination factor NusG